MTTFKEGDRVETTTSVIFPLDDGKFIIFPAKSVGTVASLYDEEDNLFVWVEYLDGYTRQTSKRLLIDLSEQKTTAQDQSYKDRIWDAIRSVS